MDNQDLSNRIKRLREERSWTQEDLANRSGLALPTIRAIETGQRKGNRDDTLERLAEALEVNPSYLKYGEAETASGYSISVPALYSPAERKLVEEFLNFLDFRRSNLEQPENRIETNGLKPEYQSTLEQVMQPSGRVSNSGTKQEPPAKLLISQEILYAFCLGKYIREWYRIYSLYFVEGEFGYHMPNPVFHSNLTAIKDNPLQSLEDLEKLIDTITRSITFKSQLGKAVDRMLWQECIQTHFSNLLPPKKQKQAFQLLQMQTKRWKNLVTQGLVK